MKTEITPRQRVLAALNHRNSDRVPISSGSSGSGMTDGIAKKVAIALGIDEEIKPFRRGHGDTIYNPRLIEALGVDFRHVMLYDPAVLRGQDIRDKDGSFTNEWGIRIKKSELYYTWYGHPLEHATIGDLHSFAWPDPYKDIEGHIDGIRQQAQQYHSEARFALCTRSPGRGIFETAIQLRGFEKFLMDMAIDPKFATLLVDKICDTLIAYYDLLLSEVGEFVDIVETQDDLAHQQSLFMSPDHFRRILKPAKHRLNKLIREKAPNAWIYHHSCGAVESLIPDLVEIGVQILNPVQPLARNMSPSKLKEKYGAEIIFHGAIDLQQAILGPADRIDREVRQRLYDLGRDGGYILAPSNLIQDDVPVENILLLFQLAAKYGVYPLEFETSDLDLNE